MGRPQRQLDRPTEPQVRELFLIRIAAGLSQRQLAELVGTSQSYVSEVERGVLIPSVAVMRRWGEALGVRTTWISVEEV